MDDERQPIVIDGGSHTTRAGFAGDDSPRIVIPSVIGKPKGQSAGIGTREYVGNEAQSAREDLFWKYPIQQGMVINWDDMETIWQHIFSELDVDPSAQPIILSETQLNPKAHRERLTQIMFETFNVPGMFIASQPVFALYASGRITGCAVDCGHSVTQIVPVDCGHALLEGILRLDLGGQDLTNQISESLNSRGYNFISPGERDIPRSIKERKCAVALDFDQEEQQRIASGLAEQYELPDGRTIDVGPDIFRCPEAFFQPSFVGKDLSGIHVNINESIQKCTVDVRRDLYRNIIFGGGNSMFPGIAERLTKELRALAPPSQLPTVIAAPERNNFAWIGGSMLGAHCIGWVSKADYDTFGPSAVHIRCP